MIFFSNLGIYSPTLILFFSINILLIIDEMGLGVFLLGAVEEELVFFKC